MSRAGQGGRGGGRGKDSKEKKEKKELWSEDELDDAEAGLNMFGTLMYTEDGEATETKAFKKKSQAALAQNADKPPWQQVIPLDRLPLMNYPAYAAHTVVLGRGQDGDLRADKAMHRRCWMQMVKSGCTVPLRAGFQQVTSTLWGRRKDGRRQPLCLRGTIAPRLLQHAPKTLWMLKTFLSKPLVAKRYCVCGTLYLWRLSCTVRWLFVELE